MDQNLLTTQKGILSQQLESSIQQPNPAKKMGCFPAFKSMKKKSEKSNSQNSSRSERVLTTTPQLQASRSLHSDPRSSKTIMKSLNPINRVTNTRTRALSAPSALDAAKQEALASIEHDEQEMSKVLPRLMKEPGSPIPQPLPLPYPQGSDPLNLRIASNPLYALEQDALETFQYEEQEWSKKRDRSMKKHHSPGPLPLPLPSPQGRGPMKTTSSSMSGIDIDSVRYFRYEDIAAACHNFSADRCMSECLSSTVYKASFFHDASSQKLKATVTRLHSMTQGLREFMNEVNTLANLQHPNLCKLLGFYASNGSESEPRMLVYERLCNGSLDRLLFGRSDGPSIDWNARMKIAICAAQGLTFLHEEGPLQAMYNDFSAMNIQIDIDFNAKLSGYGFVGHIAEEELSSSSFAATNLSMETLKKGMLTPKSNVWSFGIVLLELLTGRKNFDRHLPKKERNLVKWCRPFLADDFQLSVIMDSQLKGQFPPKAARKVAGIVQRCLQMEPSERPTMRAVVESLKVILDMEYPSWFPLQEPAAMYGRHAARSPSVDGIINAPRLSFSPPLLTSKARTSVSHHPRWSAVPTMLPSPLGYSSNVSRQESTTKSSSSVSKKA
nr:nodulation protein [Melilotus officinalis]